MSEDSAVPGRNQSQDGERVPGRQRGQDDVPGESREGPRERQLRRRAAERAGERFDREDVELTREVPGDRRARVSEEARRRELRESASEAAGEDFQPEDFEVEERDGQLRAEPRDPAVRDQLFEDIQAETQEDISREDIVFEEGGVAFNAQSGRVLGGRYRRGEDPPFESRQALREKAAEEAGPRVDPEDINVRFEGDPDYMGGIITPDLNRSYAAFVEEDTREQLTETTGARLSEEYKRNRAFEDIQKATERDLGRGDVVFDPVGGLDPAKVGISARVTEESQREFIRGEVASQSDVVDRDEVNVDLSGDQPDVSIEPGYLAETDPMGGFSQRPFVVSTLGSSPEVARQLQETYASQLAEVPAAFPKGTDVGDIREGDLSPEEVGKIATNLGVIGKERFDAPRFTDVDTTEGAVSLFKLSTSQLGSLAFDREYGASTSQLEISREAELKREAREQVQSETEADLNLGDIDVDVDDGQVRTSLSGAAQEDIREQRQRAVEDRTRMMQELIASKASGEYTGGTPYEFSAEDVDVQREDGRVSGRIEVGALQREVAEEAGPRYDPVDVNVSSGPGGPQASISETAREREQAEARREAAIEASEGFGSPQEKEFSREDIDRRENEEGEPVFAVEDPALQREVAERAGPDFSPADVAVDRSGEAVDAQVRDDALVRETLEDAGPGFTESDVAVRETGEGRQARIRESSLRREAAESAGPGFSPADIELVTEDGQQQAQVSTEAKQRETRESIREKTAAELEGVDTDDIPTTAIDTRMGPDGNVTATVDNDQIRRSAEIPGVGDFESSAEERRGLFADLGALTALGDDLDRAGEQFDAQFTAPLTELTGDIGQVLATGAEARPANVVAQEVSGDGVDLDTQEEVDAEKRALSNEIGNIGGDILDTLEAGATARVAADPLQNPTGEVTFEDAAAQREEARTEFEPAPEPEIEDDAGERLGEGAGSVPAAVLNLPALGSKAVSATEFTVEGVEETVEGRGGEFTDTAVAGAAVVGEQKVETALDNPLRTTGQLAGGLVATTGLIRGAQKLGGPRAARATSFAIQPGEELAISAARSGVIPSSVARAVPGVRKPHLGIDAGEGSLTPDVGAGVRNTVSEIRARTPEVAVEANPEAGRLEIDPELRQQISESARSGVEQARELPSRARETASEAADRALRTPSRVREGAQDRVSRGVESAQERARSSVESARETPDRVRDAAAEATDTLAETQADLALRSPLMRGDLVQQQAFTRGAGLPTPKRPDAGDASLAARRAFDDVIDPLRNPDPDFGLPSAPRPETGDATAAARRAYEGVMDPLQEFQAGAALRSPLMRGDLVQQQAFTRGADLPGRPSPDVDLPDPADIVAGARREATALRFGASERVDTARRAMDDLSDATIRIGQPETPPYVEPVDSPAAPDLDDPFGLRRGDDDASETSTDRDRTDRSGDAAPGELSASSVTGGETGVARQRVIGRPEAKTESEVDLGRPRTFGPEPVVETGTDTAPTETGIVGPEVDPEMAESMGVGMEAAMGPAVDEGAARALMEDVSLGPRTAETSALDTRADVGVAPLEAERLEPVNEVGLEPRGETRTEVRQEERVETRQQLRQERRQEQRLEMGLETRSEFGAEPGPVGDPDEPRSREPPLPEEDPFTIDFYNPILSGAGALRNL